VYDDYSYYRCGYRQDCCSTGGYRSGFSTTCQCGFATGCRRCFGTTS
jgi:hypothetical protein